MPIVNKMNSDIKKLKEDIRPVIRNPGLEKFRDQALPNCGTDTDEDSVRNFIQEDDEEKLVFSMNSQGTSS